MASKSIFASSASKSRVPVTNAINNANAPAYSLGDEGALAQFAVTGCFGNTYYCSDKDQLTKVIELCNSVSPEFIAKLAVYSRQNSFMKDMPSFLAAVLASRDVNLLGKIFDRVIDSPKMARNFVQIIRSGVTGRKSFGSKPKRLLQKYLENLTDEQLFKADVGNDPSLADIIKMVRPKPSDKARAALYGYIIGKEHNASDLVSLVNEFESFKKDRSLPIPNVPFQMLTALPLTDAQWKSIAKNMSWNQLRINLNTLLRHNVFSDSKMVSHVANKLSDEKQIKASKVFPYQLFAAFINVDDKMPAKIKLALQKAADVALENIPEFDGDVCVLVDTSGSMSSSVTGFRGTATSKMRCIDAAALFASAILRKNPEAQVIPFDTRVHEHKLNPLDSAFTNAKILSRFGGGGTDCSSAIAYLNKRDCKTNTLIMISDNESWMNAKRYSYGTGMQNEWASYKKRNKNAKLICIDITPNDTAQVQSDVSVLNVGGFSDNLFSVVSKFIENKNDKSFWTSLINKVEI